MKLITTDRINRLRQVTGLVLFAYVTTHFSNHSLGLVSIELQENAKDWFMNVWRFPPMSLLLYGSLLVHVLIALRALYLKSTLKMSFWEGTQLGLGLILPLLLAEHIIGTRAIDEVFGLTSTYYLTVLIFWHFEPVKGVIIAIAVVVAWIHGCIGLHFWLRLRPYYHRVAPYLLAFAVLLPTLALLGALSAGKEAVPLLENADWVAAIQAKSGQPHPESLEFLNSWTPTFQIGFVGLIIAVFLARAIRLYRRKTESVRLVYPGDRVIQIKRGMTVLDASRINGLPHASVCGGRGRCSTCRVRVGTGLDLLPVADEGEQKVLARIGANRNIRLACQLRPIAETEVVPLLPPNIAPSAQAGRPKYIHGEEREIAILFADLRGFTTISEKKLPYDVVFILNRYFAEMGAAIEASGGYVDKFIGDGIMALFGIEEGPEAGCRASLAAARRMLDRLDAINSELKNDLEAPLRIGIGIHAGAVVVGEMGHGRATSVTAIGDPVNTASRLESMTKEAGVPVIVSEAVALTAGVGGLDATQREIEVRGRSEPLNILLIEDRQSLPHEIASESGTDRGLQASS